MIVSYPPRVLFHAHLSDDGFGNLIDVPLVIATGGFPPSLPAQAATFFLERDPHHWWDVERMIAWQREFLWYGRRRRVGPTAGLVLAPLPPAPKGWKPQ